MPRESKVDLTLAAELQAYRPVRRDLLAYTALIEAHSGQAVTEGRIRYHADSKTVRVEIDDDAWLLPADLGSARDF